MHDLERAVLTAAARVPAVPHDLGTVQARVRRIKRRRTILAAAAAVVTVAALTAGIPQLIPRTEVIVGDVFGGPPIALWLDRAAPPTTQGIASGVHVPGSSGEIAAQLRTVDGKPAIVGVAVPQPGLWEGAYLGPAPLSTGGLGTVGFRPSERRGELGPRAVVVTDADGRPVSDKPLPEMKSHASRSMPMTGNSTALFWWHIMRDSDTGVRPVLVTYDIANGTLSERTPSTAVTGHEVPYFGMHATENRILEWPAEFGQNCSFEILDASTGERIAGFRAAVSGCDDVHFALSPDNEHVAALVTTRSGGQRTQRVVVLDARNGKTVETFETPGPVTASLSGLAWVGDDAIRYARGDLKAGDPLVLTMKL
jgi:hypothetical protein